jgi:hypothetical protein
VEDKGILTQEGKMPMILLLIFVLLPSYAYGQREVALNQPIVEGLSLAGVRLGDSESDIFKVLGFPDLMESNFLSEPHKSGKGLKFLLYGLSKENLLTIYTRHGKVEAIYLFWIGKAQDDPPLYKGKTTKGVGLGDSSEDVKRHYRCENEKGSTKLEWFCWDKNAGISIGVGDDIIRLIGIVPSGKELPDYLKPENQRF